jgi:hypothetical protein
MRALVQVKSDAAFAAIDSAVTTDGLVAIFATAPRDRGFYELGVLAQVADVRSRPAMIAELRALERVRRVAVVRPGPPIRVAWVAAPDQAEDPARIESAATALRHTVEALHHAFPRCGRTRAALQALGEDDAPEGIVAAIAPLLAPLSVGARQALLSEDALSGRLERAMVALSRRLSRATPRTDLH